MVFHCILLAGERGAGGEVAAAAGVPCKALAEVSGQPMLGRVLDTIARTKRFAGCTVVANPDFENALTPLLDRFAGFARWQAGAPSPARSAALAAATIPATQSLLVTTADHPLLTAAMLNELLDAPEAAGSDVTAALVRHADVLARFPAARCTALRFADDAYCGTNLFLFRTEQSRRLLTEWQRVEQARKTPWRVVGLLGPVAVAAYLSGLLSLPRALRLLSRRMQLELTTTLLSDARAALDVDTPGDLALARELASADAPGQA